MLLGVVAECVFCSTNSWMSRTNFYSIGEEKSQKNECARGRERVSPEEPCPRVRRFYFFNPPETEGRSSRKRSGYHQKFEGIAGEVGEQPRFQLKPRSLIVLNLHVKKNWVHLLRGESLIFWSKTP